MSGPGPDREALQAALDATEWNLSRAAGRLGMPRNTLRYRIERLGLRPCQPRTVRWERRRITGLLVALESPPSVSAFHLTPLLDELARKVESFGGRLEELHPLGFTALFGQDPITFYGQDMGTAAQGFLGWTLAVTGDLDAAAREARRAVALAKDVAARTGRRSEVFAPRPIRSRGS